jgi:hypothetical protein
MAENRTYTDKCGHVIDRATAIREAVDCILRQGEARAIVRDAVEFMTDDELMEWLVYPDTGEFAHLPEHRV